jgi:hypothetical protein
VYGQSYASHYIDDCRDDIEAVIIEEAFSFRTPISEAT